MRCFLLPLLVVLSASSSSSSSPGRDEDGDDGDAMSWYASHLPHHRDKRFLWMTHEKKMVFPPGTQLVLTPTLAMPLIRYPPHGVDANMTISTPFTISLDAMGMTDNENPIGLMPFLNPGIPIGGRRRRRKRSLPEPLVEPHLVSGGERALLYEAAEDFLVKFGLVGKPCLLRAICEMHESPLLGYGLFGEVLELFLTASKSPYTSRVSDYIEAEMSGREDGDCWKYFQQCPFSLFNTTTFTEYK